MTGVERTDAFEDLMVPHQRQVLMTAFRITGNMQDAQDSGSAAKAASFGFGNRAGTGGRKSRDGRPR